MRVVATAMRVAGNKVVEGNMVMTTVKRRAGKQQQRQQRGQWQ
jgi:hypothetical protein